MTSATKYGNNETIRVILGRRSVRAFEVKVVESEKVDTILQCGFAAPSSKNIQPCHIMVIDDKALLNKIGSATEHARMVGRAPLAIAVCVDVAHYEQTYKLTDGTWMEDCSCVMENMLLAARALGLEGCWLQILNRPDRYDTITPLLNLPDGVKLFALAVLGYGTEHKAAHSGVDEVRLHHNTW